MLYGVFLIQLVEHLLSAVLSSIIMCMCILVGFCLSESVCFKMSHCRRKHVEVSGWHS